MQLVLRFGLIDCMGSVGVVVPFDPLSNSVDTAGTFAAGDFELDEALIAPAGTPGVLDFPVVLVSCRVGSLATLAIGVVPILDLALGSCSTRCVADDDDTVVEGGGAIALLDDTFFVVSPGVGAGIESD